MLSFIKNEELIDHGRGVPTNAGSRPPTPGRVHAARHSADLPEGYRTPAQGQSCTRPGPVASRLLRADARSGLRQVDWMPSEPRCGLAEQTRSKPRTSSRYAQRRASRNAQVNWYRDGTTRVSATYEGTTRS
jgi:hypothetical protein